MSKSRSKTTHDPEPTTARHDSTSREPLLRRALYPLILVVVGLLAYSNSFSGEMVYDDTISLRDNPVIRDLWISHDDIIGPFLTSLSGRPVAAFTFAMNYRISGLSVESYHVVNLVIHLLAALTLMGLVRRTLLLPKFEGRFTGSADGIALTIALIWMVHPLQTVCVTYIIQRLESLASLFYLFTLYAIVRGSGSPRRLIWYAAAIAACLLGMGTKEMMVSLPIIALVYDLVFLASPQSRIRERMGLYVGLVLTWIPLIYLVSLGGHAQAVSFNADHLSRLEYLQTQSWAVIYYLKQCVFPYPLIFDHGLPDYGVVVLRSFNAYAPWGAAVLLLIAGVVVAFVRGRAWLGFLGLTFFAILAPSSSIVPVFTEVVAERRAYLPLACVVTIVVIAVHHLLRRLIRKGHGVVGGGIVLLVVAPLGFMTYERNKDFRTALTLWQDTVEKKPNNTRGLSNLAGELLNANRLDEAERYLREAIRLRPDAPDYHGNLGAVLIRQERLGEAMDALSEAIRLNPANADFHNNMGNAVVLSGRPDLAVRHFEEAVRLQPGHAGAHFNLALAYGPNNPEMAVRHLKAAIDADPEALPATVLLAWLYATHLDDRIRNAGEAVRLAEHAVAMTRGQNVRALDALAAAYAESGRFPEAVLAAQKAISAANVSGQLALGNAIAARQMMYQARRPYRE